MALESKQINSLLRFLQEMEKTVKQKQQQTNNFSPILCFLARASMCALIPHLLQIENNPVRVFLSQGVGYGA